MFANIIVDIQNSEIDKIYDYLVPKHLQINEGDFVLVPFGNRQISGYVISTSETSKLSNDKIKEIISVKKHAAIKPELMKTLHFMVNNFYLRYCDALRLFLPSVIRLGKVREKIEKTVFISDTTTEEDLNKLNKKAIKQIELLKYLLANKSEKLVELNKRYSNIAVKKLLELNLIYIKEKSIQRLNQDITISKKKINLNEFQNHAVEQILCNQKSQTFLLHGVTGSGKTEVYLHVIDKVIADNKTAIMLVPEISLTPQIMRNFRARFGEKVALLHSGLSDGERFDEWQKIYSKQATIVVGARSAIFAPIENVGVIIIDEEHDSSYISDSNPRYNTLEVASFRSKISNCPLVLGSATPDIETYYKAKNGEISLIEMPKRINDRPLPEVEIVDMITEISSGNTTPFSRKLIDKLTSCINNKKQAIIFINRRGYQSFIRCTNCGYIPRCTDCDVPLVLHKEDDRLKCHYCDKRYKVLNVCPKCGGRHFASGAIGTQKVVEKLSEIFKNVKIFRMDNDTTKTKDASVKILSEFGSTYPSILVGTQMIAKGHDFPLVTLVGLIDADISLYQNDFRAVEKTFDLVTQVAGRAGRDEFAGNVVLQTYSKNHYCYKHAVNYDYNAFFNREIALRKATNFPPFCKMIRILVSGENEENVKDCLISVYNEINEIKKLNENEFIYFKPISCPVKKIKLKYRYQILIRLKVENFTEISKTIFERVSNIKRSGVSLFIENNPQNFS